MAPPASSADAPYLDAARLTALLPPRAALEAVQRFYAGHRRGDVAVPDRIHLQAPGTETVGLYMPAATHQHIGLKLAHLMPQRRPSLEAEIFLYDAETGRLRFWGDGKPLTGLRTAAVSTAASLRLKPAVRRLVIFGAGVQAAAHAAAFADAYPMLETIRVVARAPERVADLCRRLPEAVAARVSAGSAEDLREADAVVTATPAPEPLFDWAAVPAGTHVVGVGSATPRMNELPPAAFRKAEVWWDTPNALHESGDLHAARREGWDPAQVAGDLFDLLAPDPPRATPRRERATVFKSAGHAAQDLALLIALWERWEAARDAG